MPVSYTHLDVYKRQELTALMGGETAELVLEGRPAVILMSGLQGSGKTTFSGKLAQMCIRDSWRPVFWLCSFGLLI